MSLRIEMDSSEVRIEGSVFRLHAAEYLARQADRELAFPHIVSGQSVAITPRFAPTVAVSRFGGELHISVWIQSLYMPLVKPITKDGSSAGIILEQTILKLVEWDVRYRGRNSRDERFDRAEASSHPQSPLD